MSKRTRMSSVIDNSTLGLGLDLGIEMPLTPACATALRRAIAASVRDSAYPFESRFVQHSGDALRGNAVYQLIHPRLENEHKVLLYEFKQVGSRCFLNVSGNPTALLSGSNTIPVLVQDRTQPYNAPTTTFKWLNRIMYALLDRLLEPYGFCWDHWREDKRRLVRGEINIQRYQVAWYSGELGDARGDLLDYLRTIYGGVDDTGDRGNINVGRDIGLQARRWDEGNLTVVAKTGQNLAFSVSLYAKDHHDAGASAARLSGLLRWDCTLNQGFLTAQRVKTIADMEARYALECKAHGYDVGFVRWIAAVVHERMYLAYFLGLTRAHYRAVLQQLGGLTARLPSLVFATWHGGRTFASDTEAAAYFGCSRVHYNRVRLDLLRRGLDITVPRLTHDAIVDNRVRSRQTSTERHEQIVASDAGSNHVPTYTELAQRDQRRSEGVMQLLNVAGGLLRVRKFAPIKVRPDQFWVFRRKETVQ